MMNQSMKNGSQHKIQREYIKNSFKIIQYVTILCLRFTCIEFICQCEAYLKFLTTVEKIVDEIKNLG